MINIKNFLTILKTIFEKKMCRSCVCGYKECVSFQNHEATVHMAHCCNEGVMFLPLIYPDYTMERESLVKEPCVPSLHLSLLIFGFLGNLCCILN